MNRPLKLACMPGYGLGDCVIGLPVLAAVRALLPDHQLDIFATKPPELLRPLLHGTSGIHAIYPANHKTSQELCAEYDVVMLLHELVAFYMSDSARTAAPQLAQHWDAAQPRRKQFHLNLQAANRLNNQLGNHAVLLGLNRLTLPFYSLGFDAANAAWPKLFIPPVAESFLAVHGLLPKTYITVHDGWDAEFSMPPGSRATKSWPTAHWENFLRLFKSARPDVRVVQLGAANAGADIQGVDVNLRGKCSLSESLAVLSGAQLHVDAESGLVHMAHALGTRSLVMFGPTNAKFFGYADNINLVSGCTNCWWLEPNWMAQCVRRLPQPECMVSHTPEAVLAAVLGAITDLV